MVYSRLVKSYRARPHARLAAVHGLAADMAADLATDLVADLATDLAAPTQPRPGNQDSQPRQRNWMLVALVVLLVVTLVVGLVAIGAYFFLSGQRTRQWSWQDPLLGVDVSRVRPDIAVITLLDEPATSVVQEAMTAGEPDTAYAVLAYSPAMDDAQRSGNLLLVAKAFEENGATDLAALSNQQVHTLAALSPSMTDLVRAQSSLDDAEGFIRLELVDTAQPSMLQAEALARYSPLLAPVQRQDIATRLAALYRSVGMDAEAEALAPLVQEPQGIPNARMVRGPFLPGFQGNYLPSPQVLQAQMNRHAQVLAFLDAWDTGDSNQIEAARTGLAGSLLQEDGIRQAVTAASLEASPQLADKAAVVQEQIDWLSLKLMVADGAVGYNIVPEWELGRESIRSDLGQAYEQLFGLYRDQVAALPDPSDSGAARVEVLRQQNMLGRLGLYPTYNEEVLSFNLRDAQEAISNQLPLLVITQPWGEGSVFRLAESFEP